MSDLPGVDEVGEKTQVRSSHRKKRREATVASNESFIHHTTMFTGHGQEITMSNCELNIDELVPIDDTGPYETNDLEQTINVKKNLESSDYKPPLS